MKRFLFLWAVALPVAAAAGEATDRTFTLDQSIQTALQNNQALLSARESVKIAGQRIVEARAALLPSLSLNMSASRYRAEGPAVLFSDYGSTLFPSSQEPDTYYAGRLAFRQVLYNGRRTLTNTRLAQAALAQARLKEEEIRRQVTVDVVTAFYDELLARRLLALGEAAARDLRVLAAALPAGNGADRALLEGVQTRLRREQAERQRREAQASLSFLSTLGLELYTTVALDGELESPPVPTDLARLLARAQEARLEIRSTDYQNEIDRLAVNLTESERFPVVSLLGGYELRENRFPLDGNFWNATVNVSLPVFDGFASRARIRQSRLVGNQSRIERAAVEDRIALEVREARGDLLFWQDEREARQRDVAHLQALYDGLPAARETVQKALARLELLSAAQAHQEAIHGHRLARARLEKAVGSPLEP